MKRVVALFSCLLAGCAAAGATEPPAALGLDPFYRQYLDAAGIPVVASEKPPAEALERARTIVEGMLAFRPDLRDALIAQGYRVAVIAEEEALLDLPEHRDWHKPARDDPRLTRCEIKHYEERIGRLSDREYWDQRARAISGPTTTAAAEDLLGLPSSRWYGETIFVHEFAHNVLLVAKDADPALYAAVERAYANALKTGLWRDEYTVTTLDEYWAEGTQFWFNSNRLQVFDGQRILSDEDLRAYDPALHAALARAYGNVHRLDADPFYLSDARLPVGPIPQNTAEVC
ncbi:glycoside hydrolase [Croceicoccus bisphenolivorans]|uniref:glycoside hydrolase n=1 Tax=Croceicoccus bisphenolivorans TaxID=1783232 RepID=UPI000A517313|nr:glycoside hydrolase [Croceicoccus bisphenolivorans]